MKKYIFLAVSALTLASCQTDDFLGDTPGNNPSYAQKAISFGGTTGKISRAELNGADAAGKLSNNFIVFGTKTKDGQIKTIYNYYNVNWKSPEGTSEGAWVYEGQEKTSLNDFGGDQSLKYWDYSATGYDFIAFSLAGKSIDKGDGNGEIKITKITDSSNPTYTLTGNVSDLQSCYIADRISMTSGYGSPVKFTFHSTGTKVSVGIYEDIPGYSIKDIKFYESSTSETPSEKLVLYANDNLILASAAKGSLTISFDENNKAKAALSEEPSSTSTKSSTIKFTFNLDTEKQDHETEETTNKYLSRTGTNPTPSSTEGVLPCKITGGLNMKVDYTLIATDGSGEEIKVKGATVKIPEDFTDWKGNFHYYYKFKITEKTNGSTGTTGPAGLYPITFAAMVTENITGSQTTETEFTTTPEGNTTPEDNTTGGNANEGN